MPFVSGGHIWLLFIDLLVLGVIVLAIAAVVRAISRRGSPAPDSRRQCPACREWMSREASICPHCRTPSDPWTLHDGRWWATRDGAAYWLDERTQQWQRHEPPPPPR